MGKKHQDTDPLKLPRKVYEAELERLQIKMVEMQEWARREGKRVLIICEGRDAGGKSSAIQNMTRFLNPRTSRVVALPAPTDHEQTQWYFQRYIAQLPAGGELVFMDRSWYNRAGVERVMGFCTTDQYRDFLRQVPVLERALVDDGIIVRKYWFQVSAATQLQRFKDRAADPTHRWKLSDMDIASLSKWDDYTLARDEMFAMTSIPQAPWLAVDSENKKRGRINVMTHLLSSIPYDTVPYPEVTFPSGVISPKVHRAAAQAELLGNEIDYVPDAAAKLTS